MRPRRLGHVLAALLCAAIAEPAHAAPGATPGAVPGAVSSSRPATMWPDDRFHRVAALALLEQLRADLLSENSATLTLERWCRTHRIASDPVILAFPDPARITPASNDQRALLGVGPDEPLRYRHVKLSCGGIVLSEADNWYVPSRLTPEMNRALDTTHTPFGKAIASLGFTRSTLSSTLSWSPLPADWADETSVPAPVSGGGRSLVLPDTLIENRALLHDRSGRPLALLDEHYRAGILAFPPPLP